MSGSEQIGSVHAPVKEANFPASHFLETAPIPLFPFPLERGASRSGETVKSARGGIRKRYVFRELQLEGTSSKKKKKTDGLLCAHWRLKPREQRKEEDEKEAEAAGDRISPRSIFKDGGKRRGSRAALDRGEESVRPRRLTVRAR